MDFNDWVGRSETQHDTITPAPLRALAATLDRDDAIVPPLWHWLYFLPMHRHSELGEDGHAKRGGFLPPVPLPRRMWAGGRLEFLRPLTIGENITRESEIVSVEPKSGRTGNLVFVTVRHTIGGPAGTAIIEEQDIVYRDAAKAGDPQPA